MVTDGHHGEVFYVRQVANLVLNDGGDIRVKPSTAPSYGYLAHYLRIPTDKLVSAEIANGKLRQLACEYPIDEVFGSSLQLILREGPKGQHFHPTYKRF
jgi:hypothetical protein